MTNKEKDINSCQRIKTLSNQIQQFTFTIDQEMKRFGITLDFEFYDNVMTTFKNLSDLFAKLEEIKKEG